MNPNFQNYNKAITYHKQHILTVKFRKKYKIKSNSTSFINIDQLITSKCFKNLILREESSIKNNHIRRRSLCKKKKVVNWLRNILIIMKFKELRKYPEIILI